MKKIHCICFLLVLLAIFMVAGGGTVAFIEAYDQDIEDQKNIAVSVSKEYLSFNDKTIEFSEQLEQFENVFGKYFEDMKQNKEITLDTLIEMENILKEVNENTPVLKKTCGMTQISDKEILKQCLVFQKNYEMMINTFVKMVNSYNEAVEDYNRWSTVDQLETYTSLIATDYIDFDQDGTFLGAN